VLDTEHIVSCAGHRTHRVLCWTQNTLCLVLDTEHIASCAGHRTHHVSRLDAKICVVGEVVCVACMNAVC